MLPCIFEDVLFAQPLVLSWPRNAFKPSLEWWVRRCTCPRHLLPLMAYEGKIKGNLVLWISMFVCSLVSSYGMPLIGKYIASMRWLIIVGVWFVVDSMHDQSFAWEFIWVVRDTVPKFYANHDLLSECILCCRKKLWHNLNIRISLVTFAIQHTFPIIKNDYLSLNLKP